MIKNNLTFCTKCCLDGSVAEIKYDEQGVCNFCHQASKALKEIELEKPNLDKWINKIKKDGEGKKYNCLLGLSGGVDSATCLHHALKEGLRPLCFTMDNGYNDPKADENVLRLIETLKVPLYRYVLDLDRFKELQAAYLKAGVINVEASYDHCLMAAMYEMADKYNIKWVLSGGNVASESIMPTSWAYSARDLVNLKDIYRKMTGKKLKGLPVCGLLKFNWYKWVKKIKVFYLLDYLDYNRKDSEKMLIETYNFQSTGGKHCENIFTKWYMNFYLFEKFNVDKRKAHFASLINAGQMTRSEAMFLLTASPVYPQLGIEKKVMSYPKRSHYDFKNDELIWNTLVSIIRALREPYRRWMKIMKSIQG